MRPVHAHDSTICHSQQKDKIQGIELPCLLIAPSRCFPPLECSLGPNEATLVELTIERRFLRETPERLIGDKAYDSDPLDQRVREQF
ncbi:MAG: hypothetical protein WBP79_04370, partial [Candidatus Acidiferrales bacterium]